MKLFIYKAKLIKIIDGDTVDALIDLGFNVWVEKRIRLAGINTPEVRTKDKIEKEKGFLAKERLSEMISESNNEFHVISHGVGKYGRCIGEIFINNQSVNEQLLLEGQAEKYEK